MVKSNWTNRAFLLAFFILIMSFSALAQNIDVKIYGTSDEMQNTAISSEGIEVINTNNVIINKYSSDYQFSLGASVQNPSVCICASTYDKIFIKNTAPYEATFTVMTNLPEFVTLPYSSIKIQPGMIAEINAIISASCSAKSETLDYNILVSNNFGTQYTIERQLLVDRCQSVSATLYASKESIKPCESVVYTVALTNTASFTEDYIVEPKNTQYFDKKMYEVTLDSNKKAYFNFTYSPECTIYGNRNIEFLIESVNNGLTAKLSHNLIIEKAYDFSVSSDDNVSLCRDKETMIPVKIENTAELENEFYFTLIARPDFVFAENQQVTLKPGEEHTFMVYAKPAASAKSEQSLEFGIKTKLGNMDYRGNINLKTDDCYALDVKIFAEKNPELCTGTYTYDISVENRGMFEERIFLSEDSEYAEVFPSTIILEPSESRNVTLTLSLPNENTKDLKFNVIASTDSSDKTWKDSLSVNVKKSRDCTMLSFEKQKLYARYGTENVSFRIQNKGSTESSYLINYEGTSLIELLTTDEVTLQPGESKEVFLRVHATKEENQDKYGFKITAISGNDEMYDNNMVLKMTDTPIIQKLYYLATGTVCTIVTSILLLLILLGLIALIILAIKGVRVPLGIKILALVLIVILIIVVLASRGLPDSRYPQIQNSLIDKSNLYWYEDETYELDLNTYFYDPDNDTLGFSVEDAPENIDVRINGANVLFVPEKDWSGNARVRFVAEDTYGEKIISSRINLNVLEVPEFSWKECYFRNCLYINALLLIILFSLVFFLRTRKKADQGAQKVVNSGIKKEKGYLYYVDKDGDVAKRPMAQTLRKSKKSKRKR